MTGIDNAEAELVCTLDSLRSRNYAITPARDGWQVRLPESVQAKFGLRNSAAFTCATIAECEAWARGFEARDFIGQVAKK